MSGIGLVDLIIKEAFPNMSLNEIDEIPMDEWMTRAVQAEWVLTQIRQIPNIPSVDLLLGVPIEQIEAKAKVAEEAMKVAQAEEFKRTKHRGLGEEGEVDPKQRAEFFEELDRSRVETAFGGGTGIPGDQMDDVDFTLPEDIVKHGRV